MGVPGAVFLIPAVLFVWTAIPVSGSSIRHKCTYPVIETVTKDADCSQLLDLFKEQWTLQKINDDNCTYQHVTQSEETRCCKGWLGENCDIPNCTHGCYHGTCQDFSQNSLELLTLPPRCICDKGYFSQQCNEYPSKVKGNEKYCYVGSKCVGDKTEAGGLPLTNPENPPIMSRSDCCSGSTSRSWGQEYKDPKEPDTQSCEKCGSFSGEVNKTEPIANRMHTCMTAGEDIYRTFLGYHFTFYSTCTIRLLYSQAHGVALYTMTQCEVLDNCKCTKVVTLVRTIAKGVQVAFVLSHSQVKTIFTSPGASPEDETIQITEEKYTLVTNFRVWKEGETLHGSLFDLGLNFRVENFGLMMLTMPLDSMLANSGVEGICGSLTETHSDTHFDLDKLFEVNTDDDAECGHGFPECPIIDSADSITHEAAAACDYIRGHLFEQCSEAGLNVQPYYEQCMRAYCAAKTEPGLNDQDRLDRSEDARCNVFEIYAQDCFNQASLFIKWRSRFFCPKSCPNGMEYQSNLLTNCPLMCGKTLRSYLDEACESDGRPGCTCPAGLARQNSTCVKPEQCMCVGKDDKMYHNGDTVTDPDSCIFCQCQSFGLWNCETRKEMCESACTVNSNIITTFDGLVHRFSTMSCSLVLFKTSKGSTQEIRLLTATCQQDTDGPCFRGLEFYVNIKGTNSINGSLTIDTLGRHTIENGLHQDLYIRQVSSRFFVADGPGFRVYVMLNGLIRLEARKSYYEEDTYGLCGTMDGNDKNEFQCESGADLSDADFAKHFSVDSCDVQLETLSDSESTDEDEICDLLDDVSLPPTTAVNVAQVQQICRSFNRREKKCIVLQNFLLSLKMSYDQVFTLTSDKHCDTECTTVERDVCDTTCMDKAAPGFCRPDIIHDCNCAGHLYRNATGHCVDEMECGCYNLNTAEKLNPGEKKILGCHECTCEGFQIQCQRACDEVICMNFQTPLEDIEHLDCPRLQCAAKYESNTTCIEVKSPTQMCFCPEGMYQTHESTCVDQCPCYEQGLWYDHGQVREKYCKTKVCDDGNWVITPTVNCTGICLAVGALWIKQFDQYKMAENRLSGRCDYTLFAATDVEIKVKAISCHDELSVCGHRIKIYYKDEVMQYFRGLDSLLDRNKNKYTGTNAVVEKGVLHTDIHVGNKLLIRYSESVLTQIIIKRDDFENITGLCGNFNGISTDDLKQESGLVATSLSDAASSWAVELDTCIQPDTKSESFCASETQKRKWANTTCDILYDPMFKECRSISVTSAAKYFKTTCIHAACSCDNSGDCECLCDTIAAFAAYCSSIGAPVRFRHQRLCPVQCDYGSVYEACTDPCPATCSNPTGGCTMDVPCVEGCVCPPGYVKKDHNSPDCIPLSECPCPLKQEGRMVLSGKTVSIDCQQCTCVNGSFQCTGQECGYPCEARHYKCQSGHCIKDIGICNGIYDCPDGTDEEGCVITNCTTGFRCSDGTCLSLDKRCDEIVDCSNDEYNCDYVCGPNEFMCWHPNPKKIYCIPEEWTCDGEPDCPFQGSDEVIDCGICPKDQSHCNQTYCYPIDARCDGHDDCGDGSDEVGCETPTTVPPTTELVCDKDEVIIDGPLEDVVIGSTAPGNPNDAFTSDGLQLNGSLELGVIPADFEAAILNRVTFTVNTTTFSFVEVTVTNNKTQVEHDFKLVYGEFNIDKIINSKFTSLIITVPDGSLHDLRVFACYNETRITTTTAPTTPTPTVTTTPTTTAVTTPRVCYDNINTEIAVKTTIKDNNLLTDSNQFIGEMDTDLNITIEAKSPQTKNVFIGSIEFKSEGEVDVSWVLSSQDNRPALICRACSHYNETVYQMEQNAADVCSNVTDMTERSICKEMFDGFMFSLSYSGIPSADPVDYCVTSTFCSNYDDAFDAFVAIMNGSSPANITLEFNCTMCLEMGRLFMIESSRCTADAEMETSIDVCEEVISDPNMCMPYSNIDCPPIILDPYQHVWLTKSGKTLIIDADKIQLSVTVIFSPQLINTYAEVILSSVKGCTEDIVYTETSTTTTATTTATTATTTAETTEQCEEFKVFNCTSEKAKCMETCEEYRRQQNIPDYESPCAALDMNCAYGPTCICILGYFSTRDDKCKRQEECPCYVNDEEIEFGRNATNGCEHW